MTSTWRDETLADLASSAEQIVRDTSVCHCDDSSHQNRLHDLAHDLARIMGDADNGQANTCPHSSATGIDTTDVGPGKVWRCDHCGLTYQDGGDGNRAAALTTGATEAKLAAARLALAACADAREAREHPELVSDERWRRVNIDAVGADRPHEVTATPLTHGGGWIYHCNACGYIDTTVPPLPCVPSPPTWAQPLSMKEAGDGE